MVRKAISSIFLDFLELKLFLCWCTKKIGLCWKSAAADLCNGRWMGLLVIQALKLCALKLEDQIMWCSTNQPMPDSEDDGLMLPIIENWRDTSNFLSVTPFMPCIYALDINSWRKKSIPTNFLMFDTKSGPWPPKVRKWVPGTAGLLRKIFERRLM